MEKDKSGDFELDKLVSESNGNLSGDVINFIISWVEVEGKSYTEKLECALNRYASISFDNECFTSGISKECQEREIETRDLKSAIDEITDLYETVTLELTNSNKKLNNSNEKLKKARLENRRLKKLLYSGIGTWTLSVGEIEKIIGEEWK